LSGVFVGVIALGLAVASLFGGDPVATTGEPAPGFTVELVDGGTFTLADHISADGRPLLVNLWASWCAPCRQEIPALSAFATANPGTAVIGVAVEDRPEDSLTLARELDPDYPLAYGTPEFEASYPNFGLPVTYFLDANGVVTEVFNGILTAETLAEKTH
jgi:cytochrome c biogenesis protein CcmG/thiol:disulfide interchange protein DsbE